MYNMNTYAAVKYQMFRKSMKCCGKVSNVLEKYEMVRKSMKCAGKVSNGPEKYEMYFR